MIGTRSAGAADHIRFEVRGGAQLKRHLDGLADVEIRKILRKAMRAGAKVILPAARANAPVGATEAIRKGIRVRAAKRSRKYIGMTVAVGKELFTGDEFYGAFQEFGWKTGKRRSPNRKQIPGKHFMQKAAEQKGKAAGNTVLAITWQGIRVRALMRGGLGGGALR